MSAQSSIPTTVVPAEPTTPLFNPSQRRVVGSTLTLLAFLGSVALLIFTAIVLGRLLVFFSGVLWPVATAGVLALILRPLVRLIERRLRGRRLTAVVLLYGMFVLLVGGAVILFAPPLVAQVVDFIAYLPTLWERAGHSVQENYPQWIALAKKQLANPTVR
ncbi:MAG: AI-2E family transporter, partial [Phycisphaerales bacterium]|nr:AI-2E family transporter [Phycisphaerales bacterium]